MSKRISDHYRSLLQVYGDSHESAQYSSGQSQFRRFAVLARIDNLTDKRVLDYGCGTATLADYLAQTGQRPAVYCGVDIVPEFFEYARKKVPEGIFCLPDELGERRFDYAFVSGVFNNRRGRNRGFWQDTVKALFQRCDMGVAFNMMSTYVDYRDPHLFYESPTYAFDFVKREITPFVSLLHDYLPKEESIAFEFAVFARRHALGLLE